VFVDGGIDDDEPLLAIPINLSVLLALPQDQAFVGFTASTVTSDYDWTRFTSSPVYFLSQRDQFLCLVGARVRRG